MEKTSSGLTPAEKAANAPVQQQISAAEQKSRMDLQMSTALHGAVAFTHPPEQDTTSTHIVVVCFPVSRFHSA